ncbi:MAG: DUF3703 domain-containing protein [Devosiaceae bacterium]|nr:DUF3703 domain-containing protein [Devosiaceae bacterium]
MDKDLKAAFEKEMKLGKKFFAKAEYKDAFHHFERAHVLGQFFVLPHVRSHIWMFFIGIRTGDFNEIKGQLIRIPLGMIGSALGKVPLGNTGGANIKLSTTLPIPDDLKEHLDAGRDATENEQQKS